MDFSLSTIMHTVSQAILNPVLLILVILIVVSVWQIGDILVEFWLERRKRCKNVPELLSALHSAGYREAENIVLQSELTNKQKQLLHPLFGRYELNRAELEVLAGRLLNEEEHRLQKALLAPELVMRLGPMFGLLGTLIPLGPGIVALGHGDTAALADSLGVAFDTTVAGVISAAVCSVVVKIRKGWYDDQLQTLEAVMEYIVEARFAND